MKNTDMEKQLTLQLTSRFQDGSDGITQKLQARYRLLGREAKLAYKQQLDPESSTLTPEVIIAELDPSGTPVKVIIKRPGSRFCLTFIQGERCTAAYETPAGVMDLYLLTQEIDGCFCPDEVRLHLKYELRLGDDSLGTTELFLMG